MQAEKRELTILFCDVLESTRLAEELDLDDFVHIMERYHRCVYQAITVQYGYVVQHLGDGVMAYFGYPAPFQGAPVHAVKAALGVLRDICELQRYIKETFKVKFDIRISIHTGTVIMTDLGLGDRKERLALGGAPNISARLQGLAPKNGIAISEDTYCQLGGVFKCQLLGFHSLKGVSGRMKVYQPLHPIE